MQRQDSQKSRRLIALAMLPLIMLALTACGSLTWTPLPGGATASPDGGPVIHAYVCTEIKVVHYHDGKITPDGKPDLKPEDVAAVMAKPDWFDQLHHIVGDTSDTILSSKLNNAVLNALCGIAPAK